MGQDLIRSASSAYGNVGNDTSSCFRPRCNNIAYSLVSIRAPPTMLKIVVRAEVDANIHHRISRRVEMMLHGTASLPLCPSAVS